MARPLVKANIAYSIGLLLVCALEAILLHVTDGFHGQPYCEADDSDDVGGLVECGLIILLNVG